MNRAEIVRRTFFLLLEACGEELGNGDGVVRNNGIAAETARHDQPVDVRAHRKADGRPRGVRQAAPVRHAREPHQQPAAHVRGLRAHRRDPRAEASPSQKIVLGALVCTACKIETDCDDACHVSAHGKECLHGASVHNKNPLKLFLLSRFPLCRAGQYGKEILCNYIIWVLCLQTLTPCA